MLVKLLQKGLETSLRVTPIKNKISGWDLAFNFNESEQRWWITYPGVDRIYLGGFSGKSCNICDKR